MDTVRIVDRTTGKELASRAVVARGVLARLLGLLGRSGLSPGEGMVFRPCKGIHTLGMRFPIDVLYLDGKGIVLKALPGFPPMRLGPYLRRAQVVVELPLGAIAGAGTAPGHRIELEERR